MATLSNNRISFTLDEQNLADIKTAFVSINNAMSFLISLRADERSSLPKMSVVNKQFVQDAFNAISNNAQLFPSYINS